MTARLWPRAKLFGLGVATRINARRKAGYQRIADREGTPLSEVEKVGGKKAFEKTLNGNYFRDASGTWRIK